MRQFDFTQEGFKQRREYYPHYRTDRSSSDKVGLPSGAVWNELDDTLSTLIKRWYAQYLWNSGYTRRAVSYFGIGSREQDDSSRGRCRFDRVDCEFDYSLSQFMVRMIKSISALIFERKRVVPSADFECYDPYLARHLALCPMISEQDLDA